MISKTELQEYARLKNYNLGQAEKDYFQEILLFILYRELGSELVFKGGTALTKCFGFNRFSEDLDFTASKQLPLTQIISEGLKKFYIPFTIEQNEYEHSIQIVCRLQGPLYVNQPNSLCRIEIDCSYREEILRDTVQKTIGLHISEIPTFQVIVMSELEILAEKVRAILTRNKARDVFDMYYLLQKNTFIDVALVNSKLAFYDMSFSFDVFMDAILQKQTIWDSELRYLVKVYPSFSEVRDLVCMSFRALR